MMKQKDAVFMAISQVTGFNGEGTLAITTEQRAQVCNIVVEGFKGGKIALGQAYEESELKSYVHGLVSNWLRKDIRYNNGVKYTPKNPGSRAGSGDETLKAIRALKSTLTSDHPDYNEVVIAEASRLAEITASKQAKSVNFDALPADLQAKFKN